MNKKLVLLSAVSAIALFCGIGFFAAKRMVFARAAANAAPQPFLVEMVETAVAGSDPSKVLHTRHFYYALREDGSRSAGNFVISSDGSWKILARKVNLATEGKVARVVDALGIASTYKMTELNRERLIVAAQPSTCALPGFQYESEDFYMGYRVLKFEHRLASGNENRQWLAPGLACKAIWAQLKVKNADGTIKLVTVQKAVAIKLGSPPAELFDISKNYTEVPPSQLVLRGMSAAGDKRKLTDIEQKKLNGLDSVYKQRNSQ